MDRLTQLRSEAGSSRDNTLDTSASPSEAYMTANESSSKYFSLTEEEDSTFDLGPNTDVSLASAGEAEKPIADSDLAPELSPIPEEQNNLLDSFKFRKEIEAANILSGGVNIFDDNENSYDGDELVIDDNVVNVDEKCGPELKNAENAGLPFQKEEGVYNNMASSAASTADVASKDTEVVLQIDGKNVNAINIGNGLYLYRKDGQEELAAVQIIDDEQPQPSFKFLKVRENAEGNLEVYEEIEVEVPKETPLKENKNIERNIPRVPVDSEAILDPSVNKLEAKTQTPPKEMLPSTTINEHLDKDIAIEVKTESLKSKMAKVNETRKSPVIHSTPNKEGIPLTKTMVDKKLHPLRQLDKVKTIEVHTDITRQKLSDTPTKYKDIADSDVDKTPERSPDRANTLLGNVAEEKSIPESKEATSNKTQTSPDLKQDLKSNLDEVSKIGENHLGQSKTETGQKPENPQGIDTQKDNFNVEINVSGTKQSNNIEEQASTDLERINNLNKEIASSSKLDTNWNKDKTKDDKLIKPDTFQIESEITSSQIIKESATVIVDDTTKIYHTAPDDQKKDKELVPLNQITPEETLPLKHILSSDGTDENCISSLDQENAKENQAKQVDVSSKAMDTVRPADNEPGLNTPQKLESYGVKSGGTKLTKSEDLIGDKNDTDVSHASVSITAVDSSGTVIPQHIECVSKHEKFVEDNNFNPKDKNLNTEPEQSTISKIFDGNPSQAIATSWQKQSKEVTTSKLDQSSPQILTAPNNAIKHNEMDKDKDTTLLSDKILNIKEDDNEVSLSITSSDKKTVISQCKDTKNEENTINHKTENVTCDTSKYSSGNNMPSSVATFSQKQNVMNVNSQKSDANIEEKSVSDKSDKQFTPASTASNNILQCESSKQVHDIILDQSKIVTTRTNIMPVTVQSLPDSKASIKKEMAKVSSSLEKKPYNNNHSAVPFGKWTEANRQEFLNKIKESKVPSTMNNTKQIKQPNDLNKREFLQKIDIYRIPKSNASTKCNEQRVATRVDVKTDTKTFKVRPTAIRETQVPVKYEALVKSNAVGVGTPNKIVAKTNVLKPTIKTAVTVVGTATNQEAHQIRNNQDLIDKTIEGIINRVITAKPEDVIPNASNERKKETKASPSRSLDRQPKDKRPASLDALEMKMNELHGIPFVERPPHQLPKAYNLDIKTYSKAESVKNTSKTKVPDALSLKHEVPQKILKQSVMDIDSEEEIIEHQPITGDIDLSKRALVSKITAKIPVTETVTVTSESSKNEAIITETDFDKFARRNSFTYENRLTVKFEGNESQNVVQTVVEKEPQIKKYSRNEILLAEAKVKSDQKQLNRINHPVKSQGFSKTHMNDDTLNKTYQSKLQMAYQSAMTAKRKAEPPITIIEDKPVKVLFIDTNTEFIHSQLNVQGKELSPAKKKNMPESDALTVGTGDSLDSDVMDSVHVSKLQDDNKVKIKHQRKQVLTPVETPELELIETLQIDTAGSPKKKRKTDEVSLDKSPKIVVPKKSYLLGRNTVKEETESSPQDLTITKNLHSDSVTQNAMITHKDTASAIDNLVKAAELLETQSENINSSTLSVHSDNSGSQPSPVKRGRGRPRKYPLGDGHPVTIKVSDPEKRPRLIDAKPSKHSSIADDDSSGDEIVRENWTMGKINENIVCPICKKLFRSENVVFKHVKHCTGPSPNRSESDEQSRRSRQSQESETKSVETKFEDVDYEPPEQRKEKNITPKKRKSKDVTSEPSIEKADVIVIEDTPKDKPRQHESRILGKTKTLPEDTLACDICGKTFRQLSYLVSHKWQHKKEESKKIEHDAEITTKSVFRCEVCKKIFRKLHHLVQHRLIHNPSSVPTRSSRKSSFEQTENKIRNRDSPKPVEDPSAAFRCEPCDKSFRKLHHLVEHRETHDEQNRQRNVQAVQTPEDKTVSEPPPQCDICKKTFRKLHHLIEHKEQHLETSSEKSDDKSIKSSLSTKDIIHECRLCYMVFPNEHSLNKHSVFCQKKKKQPTAKPEIKVTNDVEVLKTMEKEVVTDATKEVVEEKHVQSSELGAKLPNPNVSVGVAVDGVEAPKKDIPQENVKSSESSTAAIASAQKHEEVVEIVKDKVQFTPKIEKTEDTLKEGVMIKAVPRKKTSAKDEVCHVKRQKMSNLPISEEVAPPESSDDDEVRYMLNPEYKTKPSMLFMEVRSTKRSSFQIEKPNKDSVKKRASLQHYSKIPQFKSKLTEAKVVPSKNTAITKNLMKITKPVSVLSIDSDDSDVKYSFPETIAEKPIKDTGAKKVVQVKRKSIAGKRKSLTGIAKRKSTGNPVIHKPQKEKLPEPVKVIKRRTLVVEHRCDCGQLFSSAALLTRHTTLAHTPPRIRRRRSPPPPEPTTTAPTTSNSRKSSVKSDQSKPIRKSTTGKSEKKETPQKIINSTKKGEIGSGARTTGKSKAAHKGVPVPEKMKKLAEKLKGLQEK